MAADAARGPAGNMAAGWSGRFPRAARGAALGDAERRWEPGFAGIALGFPVGRVSGEWLPRSVGREALPVLRSEGGLGCQECQQQLPMGLGKGFHPPNCMP